MNTKEWLFRWSHVKGLHRRSIQKLSHKLVEERRQWTTFTSHDLILYLNLPPTKANAIYGEWRRMDVATQIDHYRQKGISFLTHEDDAFPPLLKAIPDPPLFLYAMGDPEVAHLPLSLSVVGTRTPTEEGLTIMNHLLQPFVDHNWTFVSGLAEGVDGHVHKLALRSHTIAVLGSGFDHVYPKSHHPLFKKITQNHLALSEYPPSFPPQKWQFPERNRLISGLTHATLVVEAKERSGSLITADQALEQGREVLAIPGSPLNRNAAGTNGLIKQGATLIASSEDLLNALSALFPFQFSTSF